MSTDTHPMHTRAPMLGGPAGSDAASRHYRVFFSYSHADTKWANWLMRRLEGFRVPRRFHGRAAPLGQVGPRIAPVFRDRDELPTTSDLGETIRMALRESATLVVVCSPASAKSHWVHQEILEFKRLGGEQRVFAFIVDGEPKNDGAIDDCFSPALRSALGPDGQLSSTLAEHVAADARPQGDGKEDAFVRLVAGLLGVGFDELRRREMQRRYRRLTFIAAGSVLGMAITLGLAAIAWQARNDAQRRQEQAEDLLGFMLGDLRVPLAKLNKLEVLDAVGEKAMAYFASLNTRDLSDTALTRQVAALRQIGENRRDEGNYAEAMRSFVAAYESAKILAARHPENGEMLFERAQAEYWIGAVLRKRGETAAMVEWLVRYHDTATALVALNPAEARWQEELAWGDHNLAVADLDRGQLDASRRGFLGELAMLDRLAEAKPKDLPLQFRIVDTNSWLGNVAERSGDLNEALARFAEEVSRVEALTRAEPDNAKWRAKLADALGLHANMLALTGQRAAAMERRGRAKALFDTLIVGDPQNRTFLSASLFQRVREAELRRASGDAPGAARLVDEAVEKLEKLAAANPKNLDLAFWLAMAWRQRAELSAEMGRGGDREAAARSVEMSERLVAGKQVTDGFIGECAQARVIAGRLADRDGQAEAAREHWRRALQLIEPRVAESNDWRVLMPAVQVLWLAGQRDASRAVIHRLQHFGFQPLQPWPESPQPLPLSENIK